MRKGIKVRRVVRRFELWPVAKVAFFFHFFCYLLTLAALSGIYLIADRIGSLKNIEKLMGRLGWQQFTIHGDVLLRSGALVGACLMMIATIATITLALFYNSLSSIFGGLVVSVLQEYRPGETPPTRSEKRKMEKSTDSGGAAKVDLVDTDLGDETEREPNP